MRLIKKEIFNSIKIVMTSQERALKGGYNMLSEQKWTADSGLKCWPEGLGGSVSTEIPRDFD